MKTGLRLARLRPGIEHFERIVDEFARSTDTDALQQKSELELAVDLRRFMEIRLHHWVDASVADGASMLSYGLLQNLLDRWVPQASGNGEYGAVLSGLDDLVSTEPVVALWQLSDRVRVNPDLARLFGDVEIAMHHAHTSPGRCRPQPTTATGSSGRPSSRKANSVKES